MKLNQFVKIMQKWCNIGNIAKTSGESNIIAGRISLKIGIDKTAGKNEKEAWEWIEKKINIYFENND